MVLQARVYRYFNYFRLGYAKYLSLPLGIAQTVLLVYLYVTQRIPFLAVHFTEFFLLAIALLIPLGSGLGWFDMRKSMIFNTETVIAAESNAMAVHMNKISMDALLLLYHHLGVSPSQEWVKLHEYWKALDKEARWRP